MPLRGRGLGEAEGVQALFKGFGLNIDEEPLSLASANNCRHRAEGTCVAYGHTISHLR